MQSSASWTNFLARILDKLHDMLFQGISWSLSKILAKNFVQIEFLLNVIGLMCAQTRSNRFEVFDSKVYSENPTKTLVIPGFEMFKNTFLFACFSVHSFVSLNKLCTTTVGYMIKGGEIWAVFEFHTWGLHRNQRNLGFDGSPNSSFQISNPVYCFHLNYQNHWQGYFGHILKSQKADIFLQKALFFVVCTPTTSASGRGSV